MEEVAINPNIELPELTQDWETDSGRHKRKLVCTRTQEKGTVTPQEPDLDLPVSVQGSQQRCKSAVACCRVGGAECCSACMRPFEGGHHYLHHLHIVWPQVKQQGGTQPLSTGIWVKDLLSIAPPIRTRPSFPLRQSVPSGTFNKSLIFLHQRADRLKTIVTEK